MRDTAPAVAACDLCPFDCKIEDGKLGKCRVRGAKDGRVQLMTYGHVTTVEVGPIEMKPLYHYRPGDNVLSVGSSGCNMFCKYCQNYEISQVAKGHGQQLSPAEIVSMALVEGARGIAFTYSEPFVWYEFVMDVAKHAKDASLYTVLKTNGYAEPRAFERMVSRMDAVNIDFKGDQQVYRDVCGIEMSGDLDSWPVTESLRTVRRLGRHLEVSALMVSPYCSSAARLKTVFAAIRKATSRDTPIHLLRFIPDFRMLSHPATTNDDLEMARSLASEDFDHVYIQFAGYPGDTECVSCGKPMVRRRTAKLISDDMDGVRCRACGHEHNFVR